MDHNQHQGEHGEMIELHISCRNLTNLNNLYLPDPQIYVYSKIEGEKNPVLLGHTEAIKHNLNPDFKTRVQLTYHFNKIQTILIYVYDTNSSVFGSLTGFAMTGDKKDNFMGSCKTTLSNLMGAKDCVSQLTLHKVKARQEGNVLIFVDKLREGADQATTIKWQWGGLQLKDMDWFSKSDPFAKFYRTDKNELRILVHQTEVIDNDLNPVWKQWQTTTDELCPKSDNFYVEVYDYNRIGGHSFIGSCEIPLSNIINQNQHEFKLLTKKHKNGGILVLRSKVVHKPQAILKTISFLDYLRGSWQLSLVAGIDFTYSNGPIDRPDSLHEISDSKDKLNFYQQTLKSLGGIIISYDFDKQVPVYGFGGIPKLPTYTKKFVDDCFPINGNQQNPCCKNIVGILEAYKNAVPNIELSGPTFVANMLKQAKLQGQNNAENNTYTVCLIMTDGQIEDMDDAMSILAECSTLPMSIIIIGIGDENFSYMHKLDNIEEIRKHAHADIKSKVRDIVQFVAYKEFHYNCEKMCAAVLDNFPKQFMEYMTLNKIAPDEKEQFRISQFEKINIHQQ